MRIEIALLDGFASGGTHRERFDGPLISLGRHPDCDFRFDPHRDLDVSLRHARIRMEGDGALLEDLGSTNGTFLNGRRIERPTPLRDDDVISLGAEGPRLSIRLLPVDTGSLPLTEPVPVAQRIRRMSKATAARKGAYASRLLPVSLVMLVVAIAVAAYLLGRAGAAEREAQLLELTRRTDSLIARYGEDLSSMAGQVHGLDSALRAAQEESRSLRGELRRVSVSGASDGVEALSGRLDRAELRQRSLATLSRFDYSVIAEQSGRAVVLIAVEDATGRTMTGSGFSVSSAGLIVTNRHLVHTAESRRPRRIAVIFSDTPHWLPARVVRLSERGDLALLQVDMPGGGPFPIVAGISRTGTSTRVGSPVAIIGYPLGTDTPMEAASGSSFTARYTLGAGTLSKALSDVLQIDAFAGEGSSGSPVFDANGLVIGVVYGGARESGGRIVYAVPSELVAELLGG